MTAANYWYESAFSNTARATTVRGGCSAIALTPFIKEISSDHAEVHGTSITRCTGVVYNVKVTAKLWRQADRNRGPTCSNPTTTRSAPSC